MIELLRPADGPVTQWYGNTQPDGMPHAGQDYGYYSNGKVYDAVYAAADGIVLFAGDSRNLTWPNLMYLNPDFNRNDNVDSSAGNYIMILHKDGSVNIALTGYGHLENFWVKAGDVVTARQRIGTIGETGYSFGKHLHFDFMLYPLNYNTRTYGKSDPNPYFVNRITPKQAPEPPKEWDEMASKDEFKAAIREVIAEPDVLDKIAMAVITRPLWVVNPATGALDGKTSDLRTKARWEAYLLQQIMNGIHEVSRKIEVTHPVLPAEDSIVEPSPEEPVKEAQ